MQFICEGLDLADAVFKVSKAISNRNTNPILEGIKITAENSYLTLSATDLELYIEKKIKADILVEGETVVPGKFFVDYIKKLNNEKIEFMLNEKNQLKITYLDNEGFIQCFNTLEYPEYKKPETTNFFGIETKDLKSLINKTIFSVATDDSRPILKGCLLEISETNINCVALDGYRLAICRKNIINSTLDTKIVVPAKSLSEISKLLDDSDKVINLYLEDNYIMIDLEDTKIITRLLDGEFLNYKQILPKEFPTVININKNQLDESLDRVSILSKLGQNNLVSFELKEKNIIITSNSEIGNLKEILNIKLFGNDMNISFNSRYFSESLKVISDEFIKISFTNQTSPCLIEPIEGNEYLYLILPVRILN